ncbi:YqcC family protein [Rheinheimera sp.]|uniref:YqcC family protein n=1 Tax=Rheinheimera sp. TaxID=1869214 RepID=UPI0040477E0A
MSDLVKALLGELETELKQQHLWASAPPDAAALASSLPFCYDTMPLENWLQFIFLPRMQALLDARLSLPAKISVLPIAEQAFSHLGSQADPLLQIIKRIDDTLSGAA